MRWSVLIDLRHLKTLHAIAEHGTLARAAKQLCVSQSALSHQLRDLEDVLGLSLMNRRLTPVVFSEAGERLLRLAETVLPLVQAAERELQEQTRKPVPRVHVVLECHSCVDWLLPALSSYLETWPQVEVDLRLGATVALPVAGDCR